MLILGSVLQAHTQCRWSDHHQADTLQRADDDIAQAGVAGFEWRWFTQAHGCSRSTAATATAAATAGAHGQ